MGGWLGRAQHPPVFYKDGSGPPSSSTFHPRFAVPGKQSCEFGPLSPWSREAEESVVVVGGTGWGGGVKGGDAFRSVHPSPRRPASEMRQLSLL